MSIYASQGTIKVHCSIRCDGDKPVRKTTVYFVPDKDYSIKQIMILAGLPTRSGLLCLRP